MKDVIPFFSDLRIAAIPAVQRLYDAAQNDGYSLAKVYSDLVSSLNKAGVTPPARKYVNQWLAAVKIGMAGRPELPAEMQVPTSPLAPTPGYFENLPEAAIPALTLAWDAINRDGPDLDDIDEKAFDVFFDAMLEIGHMEPSWRGFAAYAKAVRNGEIERPARQVAEVAEAAVAEVAVAEAAPAAPEAKSTTRRARIKTDIFVVDQAAETAARVDIVTEQDETTGKITSATVEYPAAVGEAHDPYGFVRLTPQNFAAAISPEDGTPTDAVVSQLQAIRDRMVDETMLRLQAEMRRKADAIVAGQLRALADEMESKVAC
nr:hypothetical protein [uncultured Shinella sp.]